MQSSQRHKSTTDSLQAVTAIYPYCNRGRINYKRLDIGRFSLLRHRFTSGKVITCVVWVECIWCSGCSKHQPLLWTWRLHDVGSGHQQHLSLTRFKCNPELYRLRRPRPEAVHGWVLGSWLHSMRSPDILILYVDKINRSPCAGVATHRFPTSSYNQSPTKIITTQLIPHNIFSFFILRNNVSYSLQSCKKTNTF